MYHIIICDDDKEFMQYIKKIILNSGINEKETTFFHYTSGEELKSDLHTIDSCDLLILDMQMGVMGGNETAKEFRKIFPTTTLVFCSGICQPTVESFIATPFRYLLKQYTDERMLIEMEEVIKEVKRNNVEPFILGNSAYNTFRLKPSDILYIDIAKRGSNIHLRKGVVDNKVEENITAKERVEELYLRLKDFGFAYAHNSYIVNLYYITMVTAKNVTLIDGSKLNISRSKMNEFKEAMARTLSTKY